ncbi:hypothetical protein EON65_39895 [archaeon]|nr:MAG: hypothetical protein EON65_39895 [archaeon]
MLWHADVLCVMNRMAMTSNVAFALRSIFRKNLPGDFKERTQLDPVNDHAVTTLLSFLLLLPLALAFEGSSELGNELGSLLLDKTFSLNLLVCGMCFYLYNELQNVVLGSLGPVPTAVGNTLKRVVIFVALYLFTAGEIFPWPKVLGCAIAIVGCFAFAIFDSLKM